MIPTLHNGDSVLLNYSYYGIHSCFKKGYFFIWKKPQTNDIIIFKEKTSQARLIKRIIASPGDLINICDKQLKVNRVSIPLDEKGVQTLKGLRWIPKNRYLVIGDNLSESKDSRELGLISINQIIGKKLSINSEGKDEK